MQAALNVVRDIGRRGIGAPILVVALLTMMVIPLAPLALDMLFTFNIVLSLIILMVAIYALRPLDFAIFPTVLLIATLLRLALNIASTRIVLLEGHTGTGAAGKVIESFGGFVVGGNYAVGLVVFAILVIINFVVVTKGAGRISEVSARFTLDALPGKQMAIDADLNSGLINQDQARERRSEVAQEADFYGSMDGASKFVRGDAIAGILILFINIIGGLAIGILQHGMPFTDAARNYTLLTIGDGLVAQIPGIVLSTATAILVTRVSKSQDMSGAVMEQMFDNPRVLIVAGSVVGLLGLIPGMPNLPFLLFAAACGAGAWYLINKRRQAAFDDADRPPEPPPQDTQPENRELTWDDVPPVDVIGLEVGYGLIPLVDRNQGGQLLTRIKGVRKKLSQELGFLIQAVHIRDNLDLTPTAYRISVHGVPVAESEIQTNRELAINPGQVHGKIPGFATKDPAFGLEAYWIEPSQRDQAQTMGYTVVDASTVVATHLSQIIQTNAHQLLGHQEVQKLLDVLAETQPKLVEELVPNTLPLSVVVKVFQNLLSERIPVRDTRTIVETLAEQGARTREPAQLTISVREALGRMIVQNITGMSSELPVITLEPQLEQILLDTMQGTTEGAGGFEPGLAERLQRSLAETAQRQEMAGQPAVLLTAPQLRGWLYRLSRHSVPNLHVLSYNEVPDDKQIRIVGQVGQDKA
ncbi:flagellar biosynthesis protein FlhA [Alkalilimnicola ehrlichii]|uniref:Flagellar biosynthesis protein FlhA n=1 Tax=Alkalilimnicola ehrlichii TaxID=351052 RepID=A0A3E0WU30_9GAMM|nr:flagellar biosynthesis protein FlhA [Alkalilimnicola ehrlichii]RFA28531.1 flagellar biosynthesis protein FlhA [Alkalilimnicola ehrlichii]RFA35693.1 flagellar biosynthesis protein FlhA [Alkalilimnicola ehrlichii]